MKELLLKIKAELEASEEQLEWEFGSGRDIEELISDNGMSDVYYELCEMIESMQ